MKTFLLSGFLILGLHLFLTSQNEQRPANNNFLVNDTLRYFLNKQRFKLPVSATTPIYKLLSTTHENPAVIYVGSVFKNKDTCLRVTGLETYIRQYYINSDLPPPIPLRLYLCNVVNGSPVFPPIDSVQKPVFKTVNAVQYSGATFTSSIPRIVKGDFAVLARNFSPYFYDSLNILRTAGHTATSTTAPSQAYKFGEGLSVLVRNGVCYKTTDLIDPQFGPGTDYEICVAPMVSFSLQVSQRKSPQQEGACAWALFTNTNTSSPELTNRQFNFNEFYRRLKPFDPTTGMPSVWPDSVLWWNMGDGQQPYYLPPDKDTIQLAYASGVSNTLFAGSITGRYKQSVYQLYAPTIVATTAFTANTVWCNDSLGSGTDEAGSFAGLKIYPNPTTEKITINGLSGPNTVMMFNMLGQLLYSERTTRETLVVDLLKQPQGCYQIKINNSQNNTRFVKIVRQ